MDNIWIFIVIIGAVISLAQKNQKKPMPKSENAPQPNPQEEWERQLREILGERPQMPAAPKPASQPLEKSAAPEYKQPAQSKRVVMPSPKAQFKAQSQQATINTQKNGATIQQPTNANKGNEAQSKSESDINIEKIIDDFSMEKAVIYAEILKPKYEEY